MAGFSIAKLVLLVLAIAVVWYGFKWVSRLGAARGSNSDRRVGPRRRARDALRAEDTEQCPICGVYNTAPARTNCGRDRCPYPAAG